MLSTDSRRLRLTIQVNDMAVRQPVFPASRSAPAAASHVQEDYTNSVALSTLTRSESRSSVNSAGSSITITERNAASQDHIRHDEDKLFARVDDGLNPLLDDDNSSPTTLLPELADLVVVYLQQDFTRCASGFDKKWRRQASRISSTCQRWSRALRPLLFRELTLKQRSDIPFLSGMLCSSASVWLREYIRVINFDFSSNQKNHFQLSPPAWKGIPALLPAAKILNIWSLGEKFTIARHEGIFFRTFLTIRYLHLRGCRFPSFSSLLRSLGNIPLLEFVDMQDVKWNSDESDTLVEPPRYLASFPNLRYFISDDSCTDNRSPAWIFAGACAHHEFGWRPGQNTPIPQTVLTIIGLVNLFWTKNDYVIFAGEHIDEDTYVFCIHGGAGSGLPLSIAFVAKSLPALEGRRSELSWVLDCVSIGIESYAANITPRLETQDWAAIDTLLSQAPHLQALDIYCGIGSGGPEKFEELVGTIRSQLPHVVADVQGRYDNVQDGRELAPHLFGEEWCEGWFNRYYRGLVLSS